MKRIVTVQDISCLGKCSLTVALPIISAMGIETSIIPTAVLSTHTLWEHYVCDDLTDNIPLVAEHWKNEGFGFDAIYTGYLASSNQIDVVSKLFDEFKTENNFIFVDPAMADNGEMYRNFDKSFADKMRVLCAKADIIVPNMTEACLLTDTKYKNEYDDKYISDLLKKLTDLGASKAIITGAHYDGKYGIMSYDSVNDEYSFYAHQKIDHIFYGTGDVFSSACVGALTQGYSLAEAVEIAGEFVFASISATMKDKDARLYGVNFEQALPLLAKYNK
ncbi:pyridoxamine kinase [Eubacterium sp.]